MSQSSTATTATFSAEGPWGMPRRPMLGCENTTKIRFVFVPFSNETKITFSVFPPLPVCVCVWNRLYFTFNFLKWLHAFKKRQKKKSGLTLDFSVSFGDSWESWQRRQLQQCRSAILEQCLADFSHKLSGLSWLNVTKNAFVCLARTFQSRLILPSRTLADKCWSEKMWISLGGGEKIK